MVSQIPLSEKTREIIQRIERQSPSIIIPDVLKNTSHVDNVLLVKWLRKKHQTDKKDNFLLELLSVSMLNDLSQALSANKPLESKKRAGWLARTKFVLLTIAGIIYCACEGFDGITAILSITTLPPMFVFFGGLIFSVLSIVVFLAFDLVEISKNLGVNIKNTSKVVDVYLQEIELIKRLRKNIDNNYSHEDIETLNSDIKLIKMLIERYESLDEARQSLKKAHERPYLKIAKLLTAGISGILFFSAGYFAGQTVALAVASLFLASVSPAFWPIIMVSIGVGLIALSVYWFVQRPGIENLISRWAGLDKDKIDKLCDDEEAQKEQGKLLRLKDKVERCAELLESSSANKYNSVFKDEISNKQVSSLGESSNSFYRPTEGLSLRRTSSSQSFFDRCPSTGQEVMEKEEPVQSKTQTSLSLENVNHGL
ncbi:MAG: hypothetical protein Q8M03_10195 [Legionella sp.]|nr:hypothetical protein [Legionella sp.]